MPVAKLALAYRRGDIANAEKLHPEKSLAECSYGALNNHLKRNHTIIRFCV